MTEIDRRTLLGTLAGVLAAGTTLEGAGLQPVLFDAQHTKAETRPFGTLRKYCDGPSSGLKNLVIGSISLNPGQQPHPPHTHPDEEILIVTEGAGEITLNGKASSAEAGAVMYVTPNYLHGIDNTGDKPLTFYFIKWIAG